MDRYLHTCPRCGWRAERTEALGYCESCAARRPAVVRITHITRVTADTAADTAADTLIDAPPSPRRAPAARSRPSLVLLPRARAAGTDDPPTAA